MTVYPFEGFVAGGAAVTLPAQFFIEVLPDIEDDAELRVTLYALYAIARRRGALRAVRRSELARETPLARALAAHGGVDALDGALVAAVQRGTLLRCELSDGDTLYLVNNEAGRRALPRVTTGALPVPGAVSAAPRVDAQRAAKPAQVYEQEIGALSPSVSDALARASERWPEDWIVEALRLAAVRNARSWRYAEAILERWEREGKDDGSARGAAQDRNHGQYDRYILRS
jgi:DnaD/phage-associated family protein